MEREMVVADLHSIAQDFVAASGKNVTAPEGSATDFLATYHMTSIDALEFLLMLEEKFDMTFEDENLTDDILTDVDDLAEYIMKRKAEA